MNHGRDEDSIEKLLWDELDEIWKTLKAKHSRRKRSPLKFVDYFEECENELKRFGGTGFSSVETKLATVRRYLQDYCEDYRSSLGPAKRQAEKNEIWEELYNGPPPVFQGGRADGNS